VALAKMLPVLLMLAPCSPITTTAVALALPATPAEAIASIRPAL
jgi:hypothetical protein